MSSIVPLPSILLLTLGFGTAVAVAWLGFGIEAFRGPDRVLARSWPLIYGCEALLTAAVAGLYVTRARPAPSIANIAALSFAAWFGELLALSAFGGLLANELNPGTAWIFWWMATAGPLQPMVATLAGIVARMASAHASRA